MLCGRRSFSFYLNGQFCQFLAQQFAYASLSRLVVTEIDNRLRHQRSSFRSWRFLQDLPCLALQRVLLIGSENVLLAALAHASTPPESAATARSYPWALTRSSSRVTVRHRPSLGRMWRLTTDAPPPIMTTGSAW